MSPVWGKYGQSVYEWAKNGSDSVWGGLWYFGPKWVFHTDIWDPSAFMSARASAKYKAIEKHSTTKKVIVYRNVHSWFTVS